jgi:exosortase/archaeosortase family protein
MIKKLLAEYKKLRANKRLEPIFDTFLFVFITFAIHYLYRFWEHDFDHRIFGYQILTPAIFTWFTDAVFTHSRWLVDFLIPIKTNGRTFFFENSCSVQIVYSCSGIKQILQFVLLILVYPGPWKHKAWFIPLGAVLIHFTNVIRISGLCITMAYWPDHWHFAHDYPFRIIFYVVIFFLWVTWNDYFYHKKSKTKVKA